MREGKIVDYSDSYGSLITTSPIVCIYSYVNDCFHVLKLLSGIAALRFIQLPESEPLPFHVTQIPSNL